MLRPYGEVMVIAPRDNQSAKSHSINIEHHTSDELSLFKTIEGIPFYCQPYTPVQSVLFCLEFTNYKPDLIVSGINKGYNMGIDTFYSGTVAVAREATLRKINSIAISLAYDYEESDLEYVRKILEVILKEKLYSDEYTLNVNVPKGIKNFKYGFSAVDSIFESGLTDQKLINQKIISLTPISVKMTDYKALDILNKNFDN